MNKNIWTSARLMVLAIPLALAVGCTVMGDEDRALINDSATAAKAAQSEASRAAAAAEDAARRADAAAKAAESASKAAQEAAAAAADAAEKADRIFQKSLRK